VSATVNEVDRTWARPYVRMTTHIRTNVYSAETLDYSVALKNNGTRGKRPDLLRRSADDRFEHYRQSIRVERHRDRHAYDSCDSGVTYEILEITDAALAVEHGHGDLYGCRQ